MKKNQPGWNFLKKLLAVVNRPTFSLHAHSQTSLEPTVLAVVSCKFVDDAILVFFTGVNQQFLHRSLEETYVEILELYFILNSP